jgi:hypothetical protein
MVLKNHVNPIYIKAIDRIMICSRNPNIESETGAGDRAGLSLPGYQKMDLT